MTPVVEAPKAKYLLFPLGFTEVTPDPNELIKLFGVKKEECILRDPKRALGSYDPNLIILVQSHTGNYNVKFMSTVASLIKRQATKPAEEGPAGAVPPEETGSGKKEKV
jgi:hypothetical protein